MEVFLVIMIILILYVIIQYNWFAKIKRKIAQTKSSIDVYLMQRFDLIPNLVECTKSCANFEEKALTAITQMRTSYMNTKDLSEGARLNNAYNKVLVTAENYPELKTNEQIKNLQKTLTKMENQHQAARRIYNMEVTKYNIKITTIPSNIIANFFGFYEEELFEADGNVTNVDINI